MTHAKPGPKPRDPSALRTVIVRVYLTHDEAARMDSVRGTVDRGAWAREVAMREVGRRERGIARAAKVARDAVVVSVWSEQPYGWCRDFVSGDLAAFVDYRGWEAYDNKGRREKGTETGPEGQRLADAALRAAGYVLEGVTP